MKVDLTALVGGLVTLGLGVLLVLDQGGELDLGFAYVGPALLGALGAVLVASGLSSRSRRG